MTIIKNDSDIDIIKGYSVLLSFAGAFILDQPQQGCINDLINEDILKNLPVKSNNPTFLLASSYLRNLGEGQDLDYDIIIGDYKSLFSSSGPSIAPINESEYLSEDHLIFEKKGYGLKRIYDIYGWKSRSKKQEQYDHLGIELQFLIFLLEKYHELDDSICMNELNTDLNNFIDNHLSNWIGEWNHKIQANARSDFYKGIGHLVVSCIQDISNNLKVWSKA